MAYVELRGERFSLADSVPMILVMRLAVAAQSHADTAGIEVLAATYELLHRVIAPDEWDRFERHAVDVGADADELNTVLQAAIGSMGERPTGRPSGSPGGSQPTGDSSTGVSYSPEQVIASLDGQGRPDLALMVRERQEMLAQRG